MPAARVRAQRRAETSQRIGRSKSRRESHPHAQTYKHQVLVTAIIAITCCGRSPDRLHAPGLNAILAWNTVATEASVPTQGMNPLGQSRTYSMVHAAIHDALNAIQPRYAAYTPGMPATPAASPDAAVAAAAKTVLIGLSKNLEGPRRADFASTMQSDSNGPSIAVRPAFVAASLSAPHETDRQRHALSLFRSASNDG
jgi:hypothetical protein